jgi:hypothetical protein
MNWKTWLKAKILLVAIALVWGFLILAMLPYQLVVTLLGWAYRGSYADYSYGVWIAQDQLVNAIFGGNPDVTVSSKVGWLKKNGSKTAAAMAVVIDWMFYVAVGQENHCIESIEYDEEHYV